MEREGVEEGLDERMDRKIAEARAQVVTMNSTRERLRSRGLDVEEETDVAQAVAQRQEAQKRAATEQKKWVQDKARFLSKKPAIPAAAQQAPLDDDVVADMLKAQKMVMAYEQEKSRPR